MNEESSAADDTRMELLARAAGLDNALARFMADVRKAFLSSEQLRGQLAVELAPSDEPWPPMRVDGSQ